MRATKLRHAPTEGARCTGPADDSKRAPTRRQTRPNRTKGPMVAGTSASLTCVRARGYRRRQRRRGDPGAAAFLMES